MKRIFSVFPMVILLLGILMVPGVQAQDRITAQTLNAPFSVDPTSGGFQIPRGSIVDYLKSGETVVTGPNGKIIFKTNESLTGMVPTPNGPCKASHVYEVPSDSIVKNEENVIEISFRNEVILQIIDNRTTDYSTRTWDPENPWIEWAGAYVGNLDFFWGIWTVPSSPPSPGGTVYDFLFNAIQWYQYAVLQPVLEWNYAGSGRWTCAAWYGVFGTYIRANNNAINASTGDVIRGTMAYDYDDEEWYISISDNTTGQSSNIYCASLKVTSSLSAFCSLEGGDIDGNEDVPGDTTFTSMSLKYDGNSINVNWAPYYNIPPGLTGILVQIFSSSMVKLNTAN